MTTDEKCRKILERILEICNECDDGKYADGHVFAFERDWGGNTATILIGNEKGFDTHTHVGVPDESFDTYVDNLYNSITGGPGLSWE